MRVLVACERTATVRDAFRARGHDAWSCDVQPTEGDPAFHIRDDVLAHLDDGWDLLIGFPPCTYLSNVGGKALYLPDGSRNEERWQRRHEAADFARALIESDIPRVAVENPVGALSTLYRKPDQIIEPWQFGDPFRKRTCLWLKNLKPLTPTGEVLPVANWVHGGSGESGGDGLARIHTSDSREKARTFAGIGAAMANQWGGIRVSYCAWCKQPFASKRSHARTCSPRCRTALSRGNRGKMRRMP